MGDFDRGIADRGTQRTQSDRLHESMTIMARRFIPAMATPVLISQAVSLDRRIFPITVDSSVADLELLKAILENLIAMFNELNRRIGEAPIDNQGLPALQGLKWARESPLAGNISEIPPFGRYDVWYAMLLRLNQRRSPVRRRRQRVIIPGPPPPEPPSIYVPGDIRGHTPGTAPGSSDYIGPDPEPQIDLPERLARRTAVAVISLVNPLVGLTLSIANMAANLSDTLTSIREQGLRDLRIWVVLSTATILDENVNRWGPNRRPTRFRLSQFRSNSVSRQAAMVRLQRWISNAQLVGGHEDREAMAVGELDSFIRGLITNNLNPAMNRLDQQLPQAVFNDILQFNPTMTGADAMHLARQVYAEHRTQIMKDVFFQAARDLASSARR